MLTVLPGRLAVAGEVPVDWPRTPRMINFWEHLELLNNGESSEKLIMGGMARGDRP